MKMALSRPLQFDAVMTPSSMLLTLCVAYCSGVVAGWMMQNDMCNMKQESIEICRVVNDRPHTMRSDVHGCRAGVQLPPHRKWRSSGLHVWLAAAGGNGVDASRTNRHHCGIPCPGGA